MRSWLMLALILVYIRETNSAVYLGCYKDDGHTKVLETLYNKSPNNSRELCIQKCYTVGYTFSGTKFGKNCWCGMVMKKYERVSDTECNELCPGNREDNCGGNERISIYNNSRTKFLQCPKGIDNYGFAWQSGIPGEYMLSSCPKGYRSGEVKRFCDYSGKYRDPVYNCTRPAIEDIYRKVMGEDINGNGTVNILEDLANATSVNNTTTSSLMIGDLKAVNLIMTKLTEVVDMNSTHIDKVTDFFVDVASNVLGEAAKTTWKTLLNGTGSGADTVIDTLDIFVEKLADAKEANIKTITVTKTNLVVKVDKSDTCKKNIHFPDRQEDEMPAWTKEIPNSIEIACSNKKDESSYSSIMYRDVSEIMPERTSKNRTTGHINAPVMSFTFYPRATRKLESPIVITFQLFDSTMESPSCTYWKKKTNDNVGSWSGDGCWLSQYNRKKNTVVCSCDHLTNFAILMAPAPKTGKDHAVILSKISMIGCVTSITCLSFTLIIYVIFWKKVNRATAILNVNLVVTLIVAYLLFLIGINQTNNKDICTAIAVLLQLVYLVVFFIMLAEGVSLAYSVYKPFSTRNPVLPLLIASYALPCVIVGISMGVVQLEGYGSKKNCWLSTDSGLIWAFVVPVLTIISVNLVIIGYVVRALCGTAAVSRKADTERAKTGIRSILVLMPVMGVTWIFGVFAVNEDTIVFQYLFAIFNSLQGVFIFVFQCIMNRKIQVAFSGALGKFKRYSTSTLET